MWGVVCGLTWTKISPMTVAATVAAASDAPASAPPPAPSASPDRRAAKAHAAKMARLFMRSASHVAAFDSRRKPAVASAASRRTWAGQANWPSFVTQDAPPVQSELGGGLGGGARTAAFLLLARASTASGSVSSWTLGSRASCRLPPFDFFPRCCPPPLPFLPILREAPPPTSDLEIVNATAFNRAWVGGSCFERAARRWFQGCLAVLAREDNGCV